MTKQATIVVIGSLRVNVECQAREKLVLPFIPADQNRYLYSVDPDEMACNIRHDQMMCREPQPCFQF